MPFARLLSLILYSLMFCAVLFPYAILGIVRVVREKQYFEHDVRGDYTVVMLYDSRVSSSHIRKMIFEYGVLSKRPLYAQGALRFLQVDIARGTAVQVPILQQLAHMTPALLLYKKGKPITNPMGKVVVKTGYSSRVEMAQFIDKYLGATLKKRAAQRQQMMRQRAVRYYYAQPRWGGYYDNWPYQYWYSPHSYRSPYYSYPYYGYGYGYGAPYFGFSIGW